MTHRTLRDPHEHDYEWRVLHGRRQVRYNAEGSHTDVGTWWNEIVPPDTLFEPTPERIATWADLTLNPTE